MASKNPIKGYIACPTEGCGEVCTVHAVGEHRVLEGGDPPKNKRRLGQLYTICPNCKANQSAGKPFQEWLTNHMKSTRDEVDTGYITSTPQKAHSSADNKPLETKEDEELEQAELTESQPPKLTKRTIAGALAFIGGCALLFVLLAKKGKSDERTQ